MSDFRVTRREFLKITGVTTLALSLDSLGFVGGAANATEKVFQKWEYTGWEDLHRDEWKWDKITYGTSPWCGTRCILSHGTAHIIALRCCHLSGRMEDFYERQAA